MNAWLTGARNLALACVSLTLFAGCATQMLAALYNYAPHLGAPMAYWYGHPLYDPWSFLSWGLAFLTDRPWIAFLTIVMTGAYLLAAIAVFVVASGFAPMVLPSLKLRRGFARWDSLSQCGLLAANGLALGAVRRHALAQPDVVTLARGVSLIVGDPAHTDAALIAALSRWQGALLFIDASGVSSKLSRAGIIHFAPGRADSACYNPLLALRAGVHAWEDARRLASAFLQSSDQGLVNVFAVLVLDQLLAAPLEARTFAALRRRLADPQRVLTDLCSAWGADHGDDPPRCEMARIAQVCIAHSHAALGALARIDSALQLFADGAYAIATATHQFRFADLVACDGPSTLVIVPPPGDARRSVPIITAMLAQLVAECATAADLDHLGRRKQHDLLIVIEAEACAALSTAHIGMQGSPPLMPPHASANGCHALLQARCVSEAARLAGAESGSFDAIAAIGPQSETSAAALSASGGAIRHWRRIKRNRETWKEWLLAEWEQASRPIVSESDLRTAPTDRAYLFVGRLKPIHALALSGGVSVARFTDPNALPQMAHDWSAPPLPRPQASAREPPQAQMTRTKPIGAQIRAALTRTAAPQTSGTKAP